MLPIPRPNKTGGMKKNMPKAISVPPPIPKEAIPAEGTTAVVTKARIVRDQWTSIGTLKLGLGLSVKVLNGEYNALFSLDRDVLTGSIGRILVDAGIENVTDKIADKDVQILVGKTYTLRTRGGKLYWYPCEK